MTIRYLITNAFGGRGTIKTTINMANELARDHDVEIVSVFRYRDKPKFPISPDVHLRVLVDRSPSALRQAQQRSIRSRLVAAAADRAHELPSRLVHADDRRYRRYSLLTDAHLWWYLRSVHDGVLVSTRPGLNVAVARLARSTVALVAQEHINLAHHRRLRPELVEEMARRYRRFDAVTTFTAADAEDYRDLLGPDVRVVTIPNAVPETDVRADPRNKVVVAAGRLTRPKGFDLLIRAFAPVVASHPDWQLRIFGAGEQKRALAELINQLNMGDHITLRGFTTRLPREMGAASIFALSSSFEGFPMVLLEAMSCGLPVVSFDCPTGPRNVINHRENGLLIDNGDVGALTSGLLALIGDDERRATMAAAALGTAGRYTVPAVAQRWSALFAELQSSRR